MILQDVFSKDRKERDKELRNIDNQIETCQAKLDTMLDMYIDQKLSKEDYERGKKRYEEKVNNLQLQREELRLEHKDFMTTIQYSFGLLKDLPKYYDKVDVEVKHKILGSIFAEKLIYEEKNYRTKHINRVLLLICNNINEFGQIKKVQANKTVSLSSQVVRTGIEPVLPE